VIASAGGAREFGGVWRKYDDTPGRAGQDYPVAVVIRHLKFCVGRMPI
jgi:hypothetical protein